MNTQEAMEAVSRLVVLTNGWDDAIVNEYCDGFMCYSDPAALNEAITAVLQSMQDTFRPAPGVIDDAYKAALRRRLNSTPALPRVREETIPWRDGIEIARRAYHAERHLMGLPIHDEFFDAVLGVSDHKADLAEALAARRRREAAR